MNRKQRIGLLYLSAFAGLIAAYFWEALSQPVMMGERDLTLFFFPAVQLWVESLQSGTLPLWNPYSFSGQPLLASLQAAVFYPPNILLFLLPIVPAFNLTIVLHFFLAGWFVYLLCRELGGSRQAGMISALAFSLGGFLLSLHNVLSSLQSAVWAPLIFCFWLRTLKKSSMKYGLLTLVVILIQFLGGGIEIFLLTQALVVFVALFPYSFLREENFPVWTWRLKLVGLGYLLFLGLGAFQIFPFWEMVRQSARGQGFTFQQATMWSLSFRDLWYLFLPDLFWRGLEYYFDDQNWLQSMYLGFIPLIGLVFFFRSRDRRRLSWGIILVISLLMALGKNTPFYWLIFQIFPGIGMIRYPAKFFFLTNLLLCLIAGLGWDALVGQAKHSEGQKLTGLKRTALVFALISALLLVSLVFIREPMLNLLNQVFPASLDRSWEGSLHNILRFHVFGLLVFLLLAFFADRKISPRWAGGWLVLLLAADLFLGNWGHYRKVDREAFLHSSPNINLVKSDPSHARVYTDPNVLRALVRTEGKEIPLENFLQERFYLDYPIIHRVFNAFGFPVLVFKPYKDLIVLLETSPQPQATDILRLLNVKYLLWSGPLDDPAYSLIRKLEPYRIVLGGESREVTRRSTSRWIAPHFYEVLNVLPRALLVPNYQVVQSERALGDLIKIKGFDPVRTVLLEEEPAFPPSASGLPATRDEVRIVRYDLNQIHLSALCSGPRMLYLSEVDYPGWEVRVDGKPEKIYRANHAFRAVALGPGRHRIQMVYRPASFYGGLTVTGFTITGLLLWWILRHLSGARNQKKGPSPKGLDRKESLHVA